MDSKKEELPIPIIHWNKRESLHAVLRMNRVLYVGFGACNVTKDVECVYEEQVCVAGEDCPTAQEFEDMAKKDPDHDWRISFFTPFREEVYQRQGDNNWVCIKTGQGFA